MDLKQIRYYCAVCEHGSFSRAATTLNVSQSALSKQVRGLEDALGTLLLIRDGRGVQLTPQGAELYERLSRIEADLAEAQAVVSSGANTQKTIAIGATPLLGTGFLAAIIDRIQSETPFASIRVVEAYSQQIDAMLRHGTLDIALGYGLGEGPHAEAMGELRQGMQIVASSKTALPDRPMPFEALAAYPIITFDPPSRVKSLLQQEAQSRGVTLNFHHSIDSLPLILALVAQGAGISVLPASALQDLPSGLTTRPIGPEPLAVTLQASASLRAGVSTEIYKVMACLSDSLRARCVPGPTGWADSTWTPVR